MCTSPARFGPLSDCPANYKPILSSEMAPHFNNQAIVGIKKKSGQGPKGGPNTKIDSPTDRRSQNNLILLPLILPSASVYITARIESLLYSFESSKVRHTTEVSFLFQAEQNLRRPHIPSQQVTVLFTDLGLFRSDCEVCG
jgi:hypothetical protein